jgi:TonB family protein
VNDPRPDRAAVEAVEAVELPDAAGLYLPSEDSPRRLRIALAAAAAVHALILISPLPSTEAETVDPDKKVYLVVPVQRFKPPEPPIEEPRIVKPHIVPVPDPDPTDIEPLRPAEAIEPVFDLPPLDALIDFPDAPPYPDPVPDGPLPIGGAVLAPVRLEGPIPAYPELARRVRKECTVILQSVIDRTGRVTEIEVAKPCPFGIAEAAIAAVENWRYAPATLNGHPVPVYMTLRVDFSLD